MDKSRLIWGIVCLVLAALLAGLNFLLPSDSLMFMVGNTNMPLLPAVILGIVGIFLLATAARAEPETAQPARAVGAPDPEKIALNKRLETIGWGCFLIMLGGFALVPQEVIAKGAWSIGVGLIMLGLNLARYAYKIKMSGFTTVLGILSLIGGALQLYGIEAIEGAVLLIVLGGYLLLRPWFDKRQLFGKAEQS